MKLLYWLIGGGFLVCCAIVILGSAWAYAHLQKIDASFTGEDADMPETDTYV